MELRTCIVNRGLHNRDRQTMPAGNRRGRRAALDLVEPYEPLRVARHVTPFSLRIRDEHENVICINQI